MKTTLKLGVIALSFVFSVSLMNSCKNKSSSSSSNVKSEDNGNNPGDPNIQASNCVEAVNTAETYVGGQIQMTEAGYQAAAICEKSFKGNAELKKLYDSLIERCKATWGDRSGSMYRTVNAFCHMYAAQYIDTLVDFESK